MSGTSKIEWTEATWNPIRARLNGAARWGYHCEKVSPGCKNCYAERMNARMLPSWGTGLDYTVPNRDKVEIYLDEQELIKPLRWKKPRMIFPFSMTDWCADFVTDEMRDRILAVCALTPEHTYQFLTKRADRMRNYFSGARGAWHRVAVINRAMQRMLTMGYFPSGRSFPRYCQAWPLPNVWLGVSAEDQPRADERVPHLLRTPAVLRWVSYEPALGPLDCSSYVPCSHKTGGCEVCRAWGVERGIGIDWLVCGGESGPGARPLDLAWVRSIRDKCAAARVPFFLKQLGAAPYSPADCIAPSGQHDRNLWPLPPGFSRHLNDRKGGDPSEWPADLRVREMPAAAGVLP